MKKISLLLLTLSGLTTAYAQETDNKLNSRAEITPYLVGLGANYEWAIINQFSIQAHANYGFTFYFNSDDVKSVSSLSFGVEPRYYYNFNKRNKAGKNTKHNSANFISLQASYSPDLLTHSNTKTNNSINKQSSIAPSWNMRRNIASSNFNYELGAGLGFNTVYYENRSNENSTTLNLNIKIGYTL